MATRTRKQDGEDLCRALRMHAWATFNPVGLDAPWYGWRLSLRCIRCGTERHDNLAYGSYQLLSRRYIHPDGYLYEKGQSPSRAEFQDDLFTKLRSQLQANNALGATRRAANVVPIKKASKNVAKSGHAKNANARSTRGTRKSTG